MPGARLTFYHKTIGCTVALNFVVDAHWFQLGPIFPGQKHLLRLHDHIKYTHIAVLTKKITKG